MTSQKGNLPTFGVRGSKQLTNQNRSDENFKSVGSLRSPGSLSFNESDRRLYYNDSQRWIPLAIDYELIKPDDNGRILVKAPNTWNLQLQSGDNLQGVGGDVHLSSGIGGERDGEIYLDIGNDTALKITKNGDMLVNGNIELVDQEASIKCNIFRYSDTISGTNESREIIADSSKEIISLNLALKENEIYTGTLKNKLIKNDSWLSMSVVADSGVPTAWFSEQTNGSVKYNICCLKESIEKISIHFSICN